MSEITSLVNVRRTAKRGLFVPAVVGGLLGVAALLAPAAAADLIGEDPPDRYGSAYEDPRYADLYGRQPPRPRADPYRPLYEEPPLPRERVYREDERDYGRRYSSRTGCPSKDEISRALELDGWRAFRNAQVIDREIATVDAQRPNGRPFRLRVDRCSGTVISARPLDGPVYSEYDRYGAYAEGRRGYRPY